MFFFLAKMLTAISRGFMSLQFFIKESKTHWSFKQKKYQMISRRLGLIIGFEANDLSLPTLAWGGVGVRRRF